MKITVEYGAEVLIYNGKKHVYIDTNLQDENKTWLSVDNRGMQIQNSKIYKVLDILLAKEFKREKTNERQREKKL